MAVTIQGMDLTLQARRSGSGGRTSISGFAQGADAHETRMLRWNLENMEIGRAVVVTSTVDPGINGYYAWQGANIVQRRDDDFFFDGQLIDLGNIHFQSYLGGADLSGEAATATAVWSHGDESSGYAWMESNDTAFASWTHASEDGTQDIFPVDTSREITWHTDPTTHLLNRAKIEWSATTDGTKYLLLGRKAPHTLVTDYRLSNGIVRFSIPTLGYLGATMQYYSGGWGGDMEFHFTTQGATYGVVSMSDPNLPTILRNDPEEVAVRFDRSYGDDSYYTVIYSLRRGESFMRVRYARGRSTTQFGAVRAATDAGVDGNDHVVDSVGGAWILMSTDTHTADTTNGGLYLSSAAASMEFGVGHVAGRTADQATEAYRGKRHENIRVTRKGR